VRRRNAKKECKVRVMTEVEKRKRPGLNPSIILLYCSILWKSTFTDLLLNSFGNQTSQSISAGSQPLYNVGSKSGLYSPHHVFVEVEW